MRKRPDPETVAENWRTYLMDGEVQASGVLGRLVTIKDFRRLMQRLPSDPRCKSCRAPFNGLGGKLSQAMGRRPSTLNPHLCDFCEQYVTENLGGAEVELTMLFADVRGSTRLAEGMSPTEFSKIINRFYTVVTDVLVRADALIEKLIGDEVAAMFVPGFAGANHPRRALEAAEAVVEAMGHGSPDGPWLPVGIGVHSGTAYVGAVGREDGVNDIVALGDAINTAARLASMAEPGEVLVSRETLEQAGLESDVADRRSLQLKGREGSVDVCVIRSGVAVQ